MSWKIELFFVWVYVCLIINSSDFYSIPLKELKIHDNLLGCKVESEKICSLFWVKCCFVCIWSRLMCFFIIRKIAINLANTTFKMEMKIEKKLVNLYDHSKILIFCIRHSHDKRYFMQNSVSIYYIYM